MSDSNAFSDTGMPRFIDLNADLGEGFPNDLELLHMVTSASVSCGAHAGDFDTIIPILERGERLGVVLGAHPSLPDRENFGRRERPISMSEAEDLVSDQVYILDRVACEHSARILFVKPHGALYNQAQRDEDVACGVVEACARFELPILGQPGSMVERLARGMGVAFFAEGFPDRRYDAHGFLVPRDQPGAVITDPREIQAHTIDLLRSGRFASLCIHGDDPRAVENARLVRAILVEFGIVARSFLDRIL